MLRALQQQLFRARALHLLQVRPQVAVPHSSADYRVGSGAYRDACVLQRPTVEQRPSSTSWTLLLSLDWLAAAVAGCRRPHPAGAVCNTASGAGHAASADQAVPGSQDGTKHTGNDLSGFTQGPALSNVAPPPRSMEASGYICPFQSNVKAVSVEGKVA